jgi:DNA-binding NarL/FixJ family response regulator
MMKIALFDDHPIVLEGLCDYFSKKKEVEVVGTATSKAEVIALLLAHDIDILVSDVITDENWGV